VADTHSFAQAHSAHFRRVEASLAVPVRDWGNSTVALTAASTPERSGTRQRGARGELSHAERMAKSVKGIVGKRLTYRRTRGAEKAAQAQA
jgi:hypothetical protein